MILISTEQIHKRFKKYCYGSSEFSFVSPTDVLARIVGNLLAHPADPKYRTLKITNPTFARYDQWNGGKNTTDAFRDFEVFQKGQGPVIQRACCLVVFFCPPPPVPCDWVFKGVDYRWMNDLMVNKPS